MVKKVLVADDDLDEHELIHDILVINLKNVEVERALNGKSFLEKIGDAGKLFDLVLFSIRLENENGRNLLSTIENRNPDLIERMVFLTDAPLEQQNPRLKEVPCISKPFSLDYFGEVIKKVCSH